MDQTLEELRAENAAAEAAQAQAPQTGATDTTDDVADDQSDIDDHADDQDDADGTKVEPESWMKGDDQESHAEKKFTDKDIGAAKAKLRGKIEKLESEHQSELERIRAELEEARRNSVAPQTSAKPKRDDFWDQEDPDEAYTTAVARWMIQEEKAKEHAESQQYEFKRKQLEVAQRISSDVDQHYERAEKLAEASGISPELYQSADLRVRKAIDGIFPGGGEPITNSLIASLGEGSEKVFYKLGVSPKSLAELTAKLQADPSGMQAVAYLGKLSAELTAPLRKRSNTPAPATTVQGDANTTDVGKGLMRKYQEAHKKGDTQAAFNIRREAKAKNINTQSW